MSDGQSENRKIQRQIDNMTQEERNRYYGVSSSAYNYLEEARDIVTGEFLKDSIDVELLIERLGIALKMADARGYRQGRGPTMMPGA